MAKYTRRIKPKRITHRTIIRNPFLNPRPSSGNSTPSTPATKKQLDSFEAEYQKFINDLKAKKEVEKVEETQTEEETTPTVEETPVVEEPKDETQVVEDKVEETPVEVVETKPKKTRKKKEVIVEEETDISEEPVNEVPEQTETTEA